MKLQVNIARVVGAVVGVLTIYTVIGKVVNYHPRAIQHSYELPGDTTKKSKKDSLKYPIQDQTQSGDFINNPNNNPADLNQPSNITDSVVYDPVTNQYELVQKYGDQFYRNPTYMSFDDFLKYEYGQDESDYFQEKRDASEVLDKSSVVPKINVDNKILDRLFGSSTIIIKPQGSIGLTFGDNFQNIENPILTVQQRKQSSFIFNMNIQMNVTGSIGDKVKLGVSYNTQSQFDFENQIKLGYSGQQDQIIKSIQAGNVTLPLTSQLIQGSQSLFGIKTTLQFGRLTVTGVVATENANQQSITVQNGTQSQQFSLKSDQYDQYRNYFLGQFFEQNYDQWNRGHPIIDNGINITRIEVWETNITGATVNTRNVVGFMDMGENKSLYETSLLTATPNGQYPSFTVTAQPPVPVSNNLNTILYPANATSAGLLRALSTTSSQLNSLGFQQVRDFEQTYARMLSPSEYTLQPNLGYIMLNQQLNPGEVLAVAYQYTYNGKVYQVGEFAEDIAPNALNPNVLYLKLLQNSQQTPALPIWQLQMKNIYSLGAYQVSQTNFRCDIFYLSPSGIQQQFIPAEPLQNKPLLRVEGLDVLNENNEPVPDGIFDFIPNVTINPALGKIIFPVVEPFGKDLQTAFGVGNASNAAPYLYQQLYDSTITVALEYPQFDRYLLSGTYQSSSSSIISLGAFNIPQGSVKVTAGGQTLVENQDYSIDYNLGQLRILNQNILASGLPINVSFENNASAGFDTKTLFGTRMDYYVNDNLKLGMTYLHLSERPYTTLLNVGEDPISNGVLGFDANYHSEADWISKALNALPFYSTKASSSLTFSGEVARLFPGHSASIGSAGQVYIDDFEGAQSTYTLTTPITNWALCSVPQRSPKNPNTSSPPYLFPEATDNDNLDEGFHRAKLAWYSIDPLFYSNASTNPTYIQGDTTSTTGLSNLYTRQVFNQEVYPTVQNIPGVPNYLPTFDWQYDPTQRGPYNYSPDLNSNGLFSTTEAAQNFGGIMQALSYTDFNAANIEYLDIWLLYPFYDYKNKNGTNFYNAGQGGQLYINLGDISEDILQDGHQFFENGLPTPSSIRPTENSVWGVQPLIPPITDAFDNDPTTRPLEDVGFDGLADAQEQTFFAPYVNKMKATITNNAVLSQIEADPSGDDYHYYLGSDYDAENLSILQRYMNYNGTEGNSPVASSTSTIVTAETNLPDVEDLNHDYTLEADENYYQYKVDIMPNDTFPGSDFVYDKVDTTISLPNGKRKTETWVEYRVPITSFSNVVGTISGFTSIRFMRMFLTNFQQPINLRFGVLQFVRNTWRPYTFSLESPGENLGNANNSTTTFNIGAVSIEQNSTRKPVNYVMPPGVQQQVTQAFTGANVLQDEQSLSMQISGLQDGDARAAYKIVQLDMREYTRLLMFSHCEAADGDNLQNGDLMAFLRVGSDFTENYYEYAIPLDVTPPGFYANGSTTVWPSQNNFNILLDSLVQAKVSRDLTAGANSTVPYVENLPNGGTITVVGNPNIGSVTTIMLGVRNPKKGSRPGVVDNGAAHSTEVWFDEMRLSGFVEKGGDAAIARGNIKLADLGTLNLSGDLHTIGWGALSSSLDQRDLDNLYEFNIATQLQLGKLLPKAIGLSIPAYFGISESISLPEYDPFELDVPLAESLADISNPVQRSAYRQSAETFTSIKSINFTNIRRQSPKAKAKVYFYSLSNLNLTYAFTQTLNHNPTELSDLTTMQHLQIGYNYAPKFKGFYPFSFISSKDKYLKLIKDFGFNPVPTSVSFSTSFDKMFESTILRPTFAGETGDTTFNEYFKNLRTYGVKWDLTKSLNVNFNATASSFIDEPYGYIDNATAQDSLWTNLRHLGRLMTYNHTFDASYVVPLSKFPLLDWVTASAHYTASYGWQAAPLVLDTVGYTDGEPRTVLSPSPLGNIINNTQNISLTGDLNFRTLYNKIKFFKKFDTATPAKQTNSKNSKTPQQPQAKDKTKKPEEPPVNPVEALFVRLVLSLKRISVSYTESNATTLPGFTQTPSLLGENLSSNAPGIPFLLGYQPTQPWLMAAANKGWITTDTLLNYQLIQNVSKVFTARANFEPFKDFDIDLTWMRNYQLSTSSYFKDTPINKFHSSFAFLDPLDAGSFSISFIGLRTLFDGQNQYGIPNSFVRFESYRQAISKRLGMADPFSALTDTFSVGYDRYQQDVLLPAFLAAYTNKNPYQANLNPFYDIPLPNWKLTYNGLNKVPPFSTVLSSCSISSGYTCTYSVGSFTNNLNFSGVTVDGNTVPTYIDPTTGNFVSFYQIPMITITEQLAPLIGINITWKNSLITNFEYDYSRTLGFSFLNEQLAETETEQITLGAGYRWKRFPIPFKIHGLKKRLNNDLELRCDVSYTNNTAITYQLDQNFAQPTSGGKNILISPTITYVVNKQLNVQLFFNKNISLPATSASYPIIYTKVGITLKFTLQ